MTRTIRQLQLANQRTQTRAEIDARTADRKAGEQAWLDTHAKFPVITPENFAEANAFCEQRRKDILRWRDGCNEFFAFRRNARR